MNSAARIKFQKRFLLCLALCSPAIAHAAPEGRVIRTAFEAGHFYATPLTSGGQTMRFVVDTGGGGIGGLYTVKSSATQRLAVHTLQCKTPGFTFDAVRAFPFSTATALPVPSEPRPCGAVAMVLNDPHDLGYDGILGAAYLSNFIWTFDFPEQRLVLEPPTWQPNGLSQHVPLLFVHNSMGKRGSDFPGIVLKIDGEALPLLLDTGATAMPTSAGQTAQHLPTVNGIGVTSYITRSILERWHARHPEWKVVSNGDRLLPNTRLIEVPNIELGDMHIGPVWFTERPDVNFGPTRMSLWMGQTVVGAAGANIYGQFRITIDYPHETLWIASQKL
ncbi:hypothetical protein [Gluconobacter cerevisiae]|nr:hypothetical protein [Gluconobacter cerevisiae]